jgi:hypothetical protein
MVASLAVPLPRRARRIVVDGQSYRWLVGRPRVSAGLALIPLYLEAAPVRGSRLRVDFKRVYFERPLPGGSGSAVAQGTVVSPGFVRAAIRHGLEQGWDPRSKGPDRVLPYDDGFRSAVWVMRDERTFDSIDPLVEMVVSRPPDSPRPSAEWVLHYASGGVDALQAAWAASTDPGVMLDVLYASRPDDAKRIERAFASRSGPVDGLFDHNPQGHPDKLHDDLVSLSRNAEVSLSGDYEGAFHHDVIWIVDVGGAGRGDRFCEQVSACFRALVPDGPTFAEHRPDLVGWYAEIVGRRRS